MSWTRLTRNLRDQTTPENVMDLLAAAHELEAPWSKDVLTNAASM